MNVEGLVLNIQRFSIHDGPGIRSLVFLKGCPLRCQWCCNPESQNPYVEMLFQANKCIACGQCVKACPIGAIGSLPGLEVDRKLCNNCGDCASVCPSGARNMAGRKMTVSQVISELNKDSVFFKYGSGGLTVSGGEPFLQPAFTTALLKAAKGRGFNTAIETCGYCDREILRDCLDILDEIYIDLKCMDAFKHQRLTGVKNETILSNISYISGLSPNHRFSLIIRMPLIPGLNDSEKDIDEAAEFLGGLKISRVELLPYHRFGVGKYRQLNREYSLEQIPVPPKESMEHIAQKFKSLGLNCQVGGK
ncbi:glycyl-radical enzyme activating protein [Desulfallas sp. Bu1-1]|uniref:glycyl-radical enzyme activating protein n=1 Tax=Desulfallas sp. Bu1-1 TaxID=2787620 RepID=UPI001FABFAD5|nr:glycyl-radical enzyme activating protein [Desulfallas sp. Bu1-1]